MAARTPCSGGGGGVILTDGLAVAMWALSCGGHYRFLCEAAIVIRDHAALILGKRRHEVQPAQSMSNTTAAATRHPSPRIARPSRPGRPRKNRPVGPKGARHRSKTVLNPTSSLAQRAAGW